MDRIIEIVGRSARVWGRRMLALGIVIVSVAGAMPAQAKEPRKRPNVLFIAIDDLNDWVGPLGGHPQTRTPNLDRLAKTSVLFERAYASSPACVPSRSALLTGKAAYVTGLYSNYQTWTEVVGDELKLPRHFRDNGYHTIGTGKIFHNGAPDPTAWTDYWPSLTQDLVPTVYPKPRDTVNMPQFPGMYMDFDWGTSTESFSESPDFKGVKWAIDQLGRMPEDKPFFLAVGIYRPHNPWYVPREYFDRFPLESIQLPVHRRDDLVDVPERGRSIAWRAGGYHHHVTAAKKWREVVQAYLASINYADEVLGHLLRAFDASPHRKDTIVVLWSDHGWQLGQKQHWRKFALWENVLRVPLLIRVPEGATEALPGGSRDGQRSSRPVSLLDIYPTLTALAGLPPKPGVTGQSLAPLLRNPRADWARPAISTYDWNEFSVRTDRYRYIKYIDDTEELYDERRDPHEWTNLAGDPRHAQVKARMKAMIPKNLAPLGKRGPLAAHHVPPFGSLAEYLEYRRTHPDPAWASPYDDAAEGGSTEARPVCAVTPPNKPC